VRTALFLSMGIGQALVFLIKLRDLVRNPDNPFLRALCVAVGLNVVAGFAGVPVVLTFMETATGLPAIWLLGPLVAMCAATQATLLLWSSPPQQVRRRILIGIAIYGTAIAIMLVLAFRARGHITTTAIVENKQAPEPLWGATPYLRDAVLVYFAALTFTFVDACRHSIRNAKLVDRHWMRRALLTLTAGFLTFLIYCLAMTGYFLALRFGGTLRALHDGAVFAAAIAAMVCGAGIAIPVLGPRWDRMQAYRRLEPLWRAVRRAAPHVVLEPPRSIRMDAWNPRNLDFRLYRRVIEIRDGVLALRPYFDPDVALTARQQATHANFPTQQVETVIEAAQLNLAIQARLSGHKPNSDGFTPPVAETGNDLDAELAALVPLAQAFATSPIVKAVTTNDRHAPTAGSTLTTGPDPVSAVTPPPPRAVISGRRRIR
jgi:hypothetical protein